MNEKHYYTELHAKGFKYTNKFSGFDSACAHFSTDAKVGSIAFIMAQTDAIKRIGGQETSHGWVDYTIGKTFARVAVKTITPNNPAWEYRTPSSLVEPVYEEVK